MSAKTLLERARASFAKETTFTTEEEEALRRDTRVLDDSDEELEHAENYQKKEWQTNVKANRRNDAEEGKSRDVVKDIWFRKEHEGQDDEIRMEPFHMRNERHEGYFDENEVYHLNKNEDSDDEFQKMLNEDQHNLEKIDNKDLTEKHKAKWEKDHEAFEQKKEDEDILQLHQDIFQILAYGETVSKALLRLGKYNESGSKKRRLPQQEGKRKKRKKKKKKFAWDADSSEEEEENYTEEDKKKFKEQFDILSDRSNRLCSNAAMYQIYDMDKSECYRRIAQLNHHKAQFEKHKQQEAAKLNTAQQFKKDLESSSEDESDDGSESDSESTDEPLGEYEFKWLHDPTKIHTPYTLAKLKNWHQRKFFARGILFRQIGTSEWKNSQEVDISSL